VSLWQTEIEFFASDLRAIAASRFCLRLCRAMPFEPFGGYNGIMALWTQNLLILLAVLTAGGIVFWQIVRTLRGKKGAGSCCSRGCGEGETQRKKVRKTVFLPVEMLGRRK
jgi:hypothetical protein